MVTTPKRDFAASWIWRQGETGPDEFCDFVKIFTIEQTASKALLRISADSNYTAYLNGELVAFGQYGDYPDYKVFDALEVSKSLKTGLNRLVIRVWYYGINSSTYRIGTPGLIYELSDEKNHVIACSDETTLSRKSRDYVSSRAELISPQLGPTYHYDVAAYDGFVETDADGFEPSVVQLSRDTSLYLRPNRKLILGERIRSKVVKEGSYTYTKTDEKSGMRMQTAILSDTHAPMENLRNGGQFYIVDLGQEHAGFLDFDLTVDEACDMEVGFGEHLVDGRCRTDVRGFYCNIHLQKGENRYLHTFRRFGCRYLQFFIHSNDVKVHYLGLRPTDYPLETKPYQATNELRQHIYDVSVHTLKQCLHEHYEDCPWREQALYTLDSRNQMLCGYYAFAEYEAPRASLELISHGVRKDGLLNLCYPAGTDAPIPSFSLVYFMQMDEYIRYSGDTSVADAHFDLLTSLLQVFMRKKTDDGVIDTFYGALDGKNEYWNFYEWVPTMSGKFGDTERRVEAPINAYLSLALSHMASICCALNRPDLSEQYLKEKAQINESIARVFYDGTKHLFKTRIQPVENEYSVLTQALCMLCGAGEHVDTERILRVLETNGEDHEGDVIHPNSLSMNGFRFDALLDVDKTRYAPIILEEIDRTYKQMLDADATTFWETIDGESAFNRAGSLCHGWSALPVYYYRVLDKQ